MGALRTPGHDELPLAEEFSWNFNLPFVKPDLGLIYCQNYPEIRNAFSLYLTQ